MLRGVFFYLGAIISFIILVLSAYDFYYPYGRLNAVNGKVIYLKREYYHCLSKKTNVTECAQTIVKLENCVTEFSIKDYAKYGTYIYGFDKGDTITIYSRDLSKNSNTFYADIDFLERNNEFLYSTDLKSSALGKLYIWGFIFIVFCLLLLTSYKYDQEKEITKRSKF